MPKVGNKTFPYTSRGIAEAQAYAKETGEEMETGEGVNVSRDAPKSDKKDDKKPAKKPAKKSGKKNPFAKKGGY